MKLKIIINFIVLMGLILYFILTFNDIMKEIKSSCSYFKVEEIAVPAIDIALPSVSYVAYPTVWNFEEKIQYRDSFVSSTSEQSNSPCMEYTVEKRGNVEVLKDSNGKEIFFWGVIVKNRTHYAVFYDKSEEKNKILFLKKGNLLKQQLKITRIYRNFIELYPVFCENKQTLKLQVFYIDTEKNKIKRKLR